MRGVGITREEALAYIHEWLKDEYALNSKDREALDMAIKALEQKPCEDAISRQAVEKITWEEPSYSDALNVLTEVRDKVRALPPVTPKPKTGHWILTDDDFVYCSECEDSYYPRPIDASWYYCPHCGAKMIESQESEDKFEHHSICEKCDYNYDPHSGECYDCVKGRK